MKTIVLIVLIACTGCANQARFDKQVEAENTVEPQDAKVQIAKERLVGRTIQDVQFDGNMVILRLDEGQAIMLWPGSKEGELYDTIDIIIEFYK